MRRLSLLVAILLFAACGDSGRQLSKAEARRIANRAQLTVADLGEGWKVTEAPDTSDTDQLESCVGADLDVVEDTLAESPTRTFEHATSDADQQQVVSSTGVLRSEDEVDRLFDVVSTERFAGCIIREFQDQVTGEGVSLESGAVQVDRDQVVEADHSTHLTAPVTLKVDPISIDGQFDMIMVANGQAVSLLFGLSLGTPIGQEKLGQLGDLLLHRQEG